MTADLFPNVEDVDRLWVESDAALILDKVLDLREVPVDEDEYRELEW